MTDEFVHHHSPTAACLQKRKKDGETDRVLVHDVLFLCTFFFRRNQTPVGERSRSDLDLAFGGECRPPTTATEDPGGGPGVLPVCRMENN